MVLNFEGDRYQTLRLVRSVKNRFGSTEELGVFEMTDKGMNPVDNPSAIFLESTGQNRPGSIVTCAAEGSRILLLEIQALCVQSILGAARRRVTGLDGGRVAMILAVLERHAGLRLADQDVFANVVGGVKVDEPAADLATALAIASAVKDVPIAPRHGSHRRGGSGGRGPPGQSLAVAGGGGGAVGLHADHRPGTVGDRVAKSDGVHPGADHYRGPAQDRACVRGQGMDITRTQPKSSAAGDERPERLGRADRAVLVLAALGLLSTAPAGQPGAGARMASWVDPPAHRLDCLAGLSAAHAAGNRGQAAAGQPDRRHLAGLGDGARPARGGCGWCTTCLSPSGRLTNGSARRRSRCSRCCC